MALLAQAARQQGRRRLLAWLGDGPAAVSAAGSCPSGLFSQQSVAGLCSGAVVGRWQGCSSSASGAAHAAAWRWPASAAGCASLQQLLQQQQQRRQQVDAQREQRRGLAMKLAGTRPRRRDVGPDRNLPARNEQITAPEVRVNFSDPADPSQARSEVMPLRAALKLARQQELDVVMVSPRAQPPVVRLIEWSKVLYEMQKREKAAVKQRLAQQKAAEAKEVRIGCAIAEHDLAVKMGQARRFLEDGHNLRLVVTFKGGQQIALGREVALYLIGQLAEIAKIKDEKDLQRPMRGYWAVNLAPLAAKPAAAGAKPQGKSSGGGNDGNHNGSGGSSSSPSSSSIDGAEQAGSPADRAGPAAAAT